MATEILRQGSAGTAARARSGAPVNSLSESLRTILRPLASLKLTVVLFGLSIVLVLVGTLAQTEMDMWLVLQKYFTSWLCWIDPHLFFPKTWFPPHEHPQLFRILASTFPIPFPGGAAIGAAMVLNLLSAHAVRFKIQTRGARLWAGLGLLLAGCVLTGLIIVSGHNNEGLQAAPPFAWTSLWAAVKGGLAVAAVGLMIATAVAARRPGNRLVTVLLGVLAASSAILSAWLLYAGEEAYMGNSGMRILWQLIKAEAAAIVLWAGCVAVFRRRAGIVLLHSGVLLLMFGQFLVSKYDVEEQMALEEGETVSYGRDIRAVELAIVRPSTRSDQEDVVVAPLVDKGAATRFVQDGKIQHEALPFDIELVSFVPNSTLAPRQPDDGNRATAGIGLTQSIVPLKPVAGTNGSEVAQAAAYAKFREKESSRDLGIYLLSQLVATPEKITVGDVTWDVSLRFKRNYKDYSVELVDVRKDDYIGTSTPRNYSSDVIIKDADHDREVRIWMNNPLRFKGETFYQSGYTKLPGSGIEMTTLQVVRNGGWMIPYVACMIVATGLSVHFSSVLLRFLGRMERTPDADAVPAAARIQPGVGVGAHAPRWDDRGTRPSTSPPPTSPVPSARVGWIEYGVPACLVAVLAFYTLGKAVPPRVPEGAVDLVGFGRLPVAFEGRVKPLDTMARASLRVLSNRETVVEASENKLSAIQWLADVMSHADAAARHPVFRIDNLDLQHTLNLERRSGFCYSLREIEPRMDEFRRQVALAEKLPGDQQGTYEKKVLELEKKLQLYMKISESHRIPDSGEQDPFERAAFLVGMAQASAELVDAPVPYLVPTGSERRPWEPLTVSAAQTWVQQLAREKGCRTTAELGRKLGEEALAAGRVEELARQQLRETVREFAKREKQTASVDEVLAKMPADMRDGLLESNRRLIRERLMENVVAAVDGALGRNSLSEPPHAATASLMVLLSSYKHGNASEFNAELVRYGALLKELQPAGFNPSRIGLEAYFNHFSPFFYAAWMYLVPFVLGCAAWLGWHRILNRAAWWTLLFIFAVHTFAIVCRIGISGRPPVTNLYSSAIFIGWGGVLLGIVLERIFRLGIGNIVASTIGFATLYVAFLLNTVVFEHKGDTMTVMQAVLDTQFWLATHVVCITLGYSTTFLAGILGIVFVLGGVFSRRMPKFAARDLSRMVYGTLCFAILFSFVGTVLGGLWADDSWGRFWGWDPKENGALIIVLWNALVLHARWDGWIKDRGLAVMSIVGNIVTSWSWFGVNELGVGLHSYGFTEGVLLALGLFVLSQLVVIGIGLLPGHLWMSRVPRKPATGAA